MVMSSKFKVTDDTLKMCFSAEAVYLVDNLCVAMCTSVVICLSLVFTTLHGMQMRSRLSVRPSVCPSVTRVICDKTVERSVQIYIPYERTFSLVF